MLLIKGREVFFLLKIKEEYFLSLSFRLKREIKIFYERKGLNMILKVSQIDKGFNNASFEILENDKSVGAIRIHGEPNSENSFIKGIFDNNKFSLNYVNRKYNEKEISNPYIIINNNRAGTVYNPVNSNNIFNKTTHQKLTLDDSMYDCYNVGFGKEGVKKIIFYDDKQIALVEYDTLIHNELFNFNIYVEDSAAALITILFIIHSYTTSYFSYEDINFDKVKKVHSITLNKDIKIKYDPEFKEKIINEKTNS